LRLSRQPATIAPLKNYPDPFFLWSSESNRGTNSYDLIIFHFFGGFMNFFVKGIVAGLMSLLMTVTVVQAGEVAVIETTLGNIELEFLVSKAPKHVKNFKKLAAKGFYDGTTFHRVIPGFMIQGGDPNTKSDDRSKHGMGGPGFTIKAEFNDTPHDRGILSMARSSDPDSAGSQFYIVVDESHFLDNNYTAFGRVIKGMKIVDKIVNVPRDQKDNPKSRVEMKSVKIVKR
jgi:peptidyl-prolyl cis-trans isomerase B (cyclophilin B)